jgi:hypothetical protein
MLHLIEKRIKNKNGKYTMKNIRIKKVLMNLMLEKALGMMSTEG